MFKNILEFIEDHPWWSMIFVIVVIDGIARILGR